MLPIVVREDDKEKFTPPAPVASPVGMPVAMSCTAGHRTVPDGRGTTGVWECSIGRFRRQVAEAEYSFIIDGEGSFTPDGCAPIEFCAGDALYFPANTQGEWEILKVVRKAYLILS